MAAKMALVAASTTKHKRTKNNYEQNNLLQSICATQFNNKLTDNLQQKRQRQQQRKTTKRNIADAKTGRTSCKNNRRIFHSSVVRLCVHNVQRNGFNMEM